MHLYFQLDVRVQPKRLDRRPKIKTECMATQAIQPHSWVYNQCKTDYLVAQHLKSKHLSRFKKLNQLRVRSAPDSNELRLLSKIKPIVCSSAILPQRI